jgi:hypothetical protein
MAFHVAAYDPGITVRDNVEMTGKFSDALVTQVLVKCQMSNTRRTKEM